MKKFEFPLIVSALLFSLLSLTLSVLILVRLESLEEVQLQGTQSTFQGAGNVNEDQAKTDFVNCIESANTEYEAAKAEACRQQNINNRLSPNSPCLNFAPATDRRLEADQANRIDTCKALYQ